jgi:NAD(P)-dependent dehydrogenase (short-subunit alcohol dehydrogenase family)
MSSEDHFNLNGKVALITGGSKGIGKHIAIDLAKAGAKVVIVSRHLAEGQRIAREIEKSYGPAIALSADISRTDTLPPMVEAALDSFGKIDILVNNAGTNIRKPALDFQEEEWDRVLNTNLKGTFFCSQVVARTMANAGGGKIINISSAAGGKAVPWLTPYSVSKAGIIHMTRALAIEWAQYGITVNAIAPSYIETPMTREWLSDPKRHDLIAKRSPLNRVGQQTDLTGAILLFASDNSNFITGQTLFVDGGSGAGWVIRWDEIESPEGA